MNCSYDDFLDLFFSDNTDMLATATASSCVEDGYIMNDSLLNMDWDNNLCDVIESSPMMPCNSVSSSLSMANGVDEEESKGLRLVHLLVATAEALTGANKTRELTQVLLARLNDLISTSDQTSMERLAAYFTNGLSSLLQKTNVNKNRQCHDDVHDEADVISAFQLLQNMTPYVNFGYFTATQAILEAVKFDRRVHIVDYDITEGVQWASLMQGLISGPLTQHLKITALSRASNGKTVQETGRRLTAFAESIGQPFSFHQCKVETDIFNPLSLKLVRGEAVVINCMLHLPRFTHQTPNSLISFLLEAKTLNPKLVTLVHEEVGLMGNQGFLYRFMDLLHQFSAIFDSLEAGCSIANPVRSFIEHVYIGPWISSWLSRITITADESFASWPRWLETNGFKPVDISLANRCQAKFLLSLFNDGYNVEDLGPNGLVLGWKSRRLLSASFWASHESN